MSVDNKNFIKKSQEILKSLGIEVKTTQLYEFYAKLAGEKNWNIAKNKKIDFYKLLKLNSSEPEGLIENLKQEISNYPKFQGSPCSKEEIITYIVSLIKEVPLNETFFISETEIERLDLEIDKNLAEIVAAGLMEWLLTKKLGRYKIHQAYELFQKHNEIKNNFIKHFLKSIILKSDNKVAIGIYQNKILEYNKANKKKVFSTNIEVLSLDDLIELVNLSIPNFSLNFKKWINLKFKEVKLSSLEESYYTLKKSIQDISS